MPIVLDTPLLVAYAHEGDEDHERACRIMRRVLRGEHGTPVAPDYVLDEGLTVLQRRTGQPEDARAFASYFVPVEDLAGGPILELVHVSEPVVDGACRLFFEHFERSLSFTDCVVVRLARRLDGSVGTIDEDFEGLVGTVTS